MATIRTTWTNHGGNGNNLIYRKKDSGDYVQIGSKESSDTSYDDESITLNGDYTYKVINESGGTFSAPGNTVTYSAGEAGDGEPPDDLSATWDGDTNIAHVEWTNGDGTGENVIERKKGSGSYAEVGRVASDVEEFDDDTITENDDYTYRVRNESVDGYSNEDTITVDTFGGEGGGDVGTKPTDLYISTFSSTFGNGTLHWTNHGGVGGNLVEISLDNVTYEIIDTIDASGNECFFHVDTGGFYYFRVSNLSALSDEDPYAHYSEFLTLDGGGEV